MPDAKSGRVHILRHLAVPGDVAAEDTGNHFLLSLTRRSERCRSGSQISGAGLYERHGAKGRCRSVEGGWLFNGLKKELHELSHPALKPNKTTQPSWAHRAARMPHSNHFCRQIDTVVQLK